jgi:hypothetical protein
MIAYLEIMIPLLAALVTAAWGYKKFLDERDFKSYQENVKNLFSSDKEVLLSAIATLGFYKDKKRYSDDVIDILLNRFYTELDYDVINAVIMELSQVSTKDEIVYISQKLLDINRNFVIQKSPTQERRKAIEGIYNTLEVQYFEQRKRAGNPDDDITQQQKKYLNEKRNELLHYNDLLEYKLAWHEQMVSDALGMSLLQANRRGVTRDFKLTFYGNSISYSQLYNIVLGQWIIRFTDFTSTSLQEISSSKISIFSSTFKNCTVRRCCFKEGKISNVEFINTKLDTVTFKNIEFEDVYFIGVELNNCDFKDARGLNPLLFYNCKITASCSFNEEFDESMINSTTKEQLIINLQNSSRSLYGKWLITNAVDNQDTSEQS